MADSFSLPVTREQIAALSAKGKSIGIDPNATSGTLPEISGVRLSYLLNKDWSSATGLSIEFTVVKKPRLIPVSVIKNRVKSLLGV